MTTSERCRMIARRLDAGDVSVCSEQASFICAHRGEVWELRAAQQDKRNTRNGPVGANTRTVANMRVVESRTMRAVSVPEPDDDDRDRDEVSDADQPCECSCPECRVGDCEHCSNEDCDDRACVHGNDEDAEGANQDDDDEESDDDRRRKDDDEE